MEERQGRTLWVDVGTLVAWQGNPVGIARTLCELVRHWQADYGDRVRLCTFNHIDRVYYPVYVIPPPAPAPVPPAPPPVAAEPPRSPLKKALRAWVPEPLRLACGYQVASAKCVGGYVKALAARAAQAGRRALARRAPAAAAPAAEPADFRRGDVLFLGGLTWLHSATCAELQALRQTAGVRVANLIYDIIPLRCPHLCAPYLWELMNGWVPSVLNCSDVAVTISEHSRRDLEDYGRSRGLEMPPVETIRLGDEPGDDDRESPPAGLADDEPFALYVSTVGLHKNHQLLFHVWRRLIDRHGEQVPKLVLVGGHGWRKETVLEDMRSDPELSRRVVTLAADDHQLRWLYRRCLFTVYPSHYEGWGLPVAEGMALGKFCVCSSAASLPEVGGDLACYHDPLDGPGCLALVERAILEPGWLAAREERVRREYRPTTWRDTARQTFDLLDQHFRLEEKLTTAPRLLHAA